MNCNVRITSNIWKKWVKSVNNFITNSKKCGHDMLTLTSRLRKNTGCKSKGHKCSFLRYKNGKPDTMHQKPVKASSWKTWEWCSKTNEKACSNVKCEKCLSSTKVKGRCSKLSSENQGKIYKTAFIKYKDWGKSWKRAEWGKVSLDNMNRDLTNMKTSSWWWLSKTWGWTSYWEWKSRK